MNKISYFKSGVYAFIATICILGTVSGCTSDSKKYEPTYANDSTHKKILLFGVPDQPYYNITSLFVKYLNAHLKNVQIQTVACFSLTEYLNKLDAHYFDLTIVNGAKALQAQYNDYTIIGKASDNDNYKGVILVNKDSFINKFSDLKGKTVASPGQSALAGHMMPVLYLYKNGLDVKKDLRFLYSSSFESVILDVYLGKCAAGFTWIANWNSFVKSRPEIASKVAIKWETPPLPNTAIIFRNDMDRDVTAELESLFFSMNNSEQGKTALGKIGFTKLEPADSSAYQPIKNFIKEYNAAMH